MASQKNDSSRRDFLKTSTAAAAAGSVLSSLNAVQAAHTSYDETVRLGMIGCGGRCTGAADQAMNTEGPTKLVAMCDAFDDRLQGSLKTLQRKHKDKVDVPAELPAPASPRVIVPLLLARPRSRVVLRRHSTGRRGRWHALPAGAAAPAGQDPGGVPACRHGRVAPAHLGGGDVTSGGREGGRCGKRRVLLRSCGAGRVRTLACLQIAYEAPSGLVQGGGHQGRIHGQGADVEPGHAGHGVVA